MYNYDLTSVQRKQLLNVFLITTFVTKPEERIQMYMDFEENGLSEVCFLQKSFRGVFFSIRAVMVCITLSQAKSPATDGHY